MMTTTYRESKLSARNDAAKVLKCKPGFKQQGAVCKPIKEAEDSESNVSRPKSSGRNTAISLTVAAGLVLASGIGVTASVLANDIKNVGIDASDMEMAPQGDEFNKEAIAAEYDKKFKPGDLIRSTIPFPLAANKSVYHYGIYAGKGEVIQTEPDKSGGVGIGRSFAHVPDFPMAKYQLVDKPSDYDEKGAIQSREQTLKLAESLVGLPYNYNLESNCESFGRLLAYGKSVTPESQSERSSKFGTKTGEILGKIYDRVALGGVLSRGLLADDIQKALEEHNYDPEVIKIIFKDKIDQRKQEIEAKNKRTDSNISLLSDLTDPKEFVQLVQQTSSNFSGAAKLILEKELYKAYLIALFLSVSKPSTKTTKEDSALDRATKLVADTVHKYSNRWDAKELKCKPGFKQQGAVCKPIKEVEASKSSGNQSSGEQSKPKKKSSFPILPVSLAAGAILGVGVGVGGKALVDEALRATNAEVSHLKKFPPGNMSESELQAIAIEYDKRFKPGDLIRCGFAQGKVDGKEAWVHHYGIYAGKGTIIETSLDLSGAPSVRTGRVHSDGGGKVSTSEYELVPMPEGVTPFSNEKSLQLAKSLVGIPFNWDMLSSNCESFARACAYGQAESTQGDKTRPFTRNAVAKMLKVLDPVVTNGKNGAGLKANEIQAEMEKHGYDPELIQTALKEKVVFRLKEIDEGKVALAAKTIKVNNDSKLAKVSAETGGLAKVLDAAGLKQPEEFADMVEQTSSKFNGVAKLALEQKLYQTYFIAIFSALSKPKQSKNDSIQSVEYMVAWANARYDARIRVSVPAKNGRKAYSYYREGKTTVEDPATVSNRIPQNTDQKVAEADLLNLMSIRDLRNEVRSRDISNYSYMTQDQLRTAIRVHDTDPQQRENIRKSLQKQKDYDTLKKVKSSEIGRAIGVISPSLGRQFNLLSAIGRKFKNNPTEAIILALPAIAGTTKIVMGLLQKQRISNLKEAAGAAVNAAEDYRKDIGEETKSDSVNFYVGGYGRGSKDLYNKVANSPLATDQDASWLKKAENIPINRQGEDIPVAHNAPQALGNNIATGYNVAVNNTMRRGKAKESIELAAKLYAHGTKWRTDKDGIRSMPSIQVLAAEDGGVVARDAIEILNQMTKDPSTSVTGKQIAERVKLVTLGTPYFGESKADLPEVNLIGDGDPWSSLPFNKGAQSQRVSGVGGSSQGSYTSSANGVAAIFKNMRSGTDTRGLVDKDSIKEVSSAQKKAETQSVTEASQAVATAAKSVSDKAKAEKEAILDRLIIEELKNKAGNSIKELERLIGDPDATRRARNKVNNRLRDEKDAAERAERAKRMGVT